MLRDNAGVRNDQNGRSVDDDVVVLALQAFHEVCELLRGEHVGGVDLRAVAHKNVSTKTLVPYHHVVKRRFASENGDDALFALGVEILGEDPATDIALD
jgi:hypothetical protein